MCVSSCPRNSLQLRLIVALIIQRALPQESPEAGAVKASRAGVGGRFLKMQITVLRDQRGTVCDKSMVSEFGTRFGTRCVPRALQNRLAFPVKSLKVHLFRL